MEDLSIGVLGSVWSLIRKRYDEDPAFAELDCNGYCEWANRTIVYCDMTTYKGYEKETKEHCDAEERLVLRHEIVHAFFNESGLMANAHRSERSVAHDEEIVDWIAIQGSKIYEAWQEARCLP